MLVRVMPITVPATLEGTFVLDVSAYAVWRNAVIGTRRRLCGAHNKTCNLADHEILLK